MTSFVDGSLRPKASVHRLTGVRARVDLHSEYERYEGGEGEPQRHRIKLPTAAGKRILVPEESHSRSLSRQRIFHAAVCNTLVSLQFLFYTFRRDYGQVPVESGAAAILLAY